MGLKNIYRVYVEKLEFLRNYIYRAYGIVNLFLSGIYHFRPFGEFYNFFEQILEHNERPSVRPILEAWNI